MICLTEAGFLSCANTALGIDVHREFLGATKAELGEGGISPQSAIVGADELGLPVAEEVLRRRIRRGDPPLGAHDQERIADGGEHLLDEVASNGRGLEFFAEHVEVQVQVRVQVRVQDPDLDTQRNRSHRIVISAAG